MTLINRKWILKQRPTASLATDNLQLVEAPAASPADGQILIRNIYLSLDPTNRIWMSDRDQYLPPVGLGDVMRGATWAWWLIAGPNGSRRRSGASPGWRLATLYDR